MAETQDAAVGYGGEFHLGNPTTLYECQQVTGFDIPGEGAREQTEKTHLKSPGWRREYLSTFYEDSDFEVTLNSRPLSDTDTLLSTANKTGDVRPFKAVIPEDGVPVAQITGTAKCIGYTRGTLSADGVTEATATFRVVTVDDVEEYEEPTP
ncbi:phage tail protein [Novosphingobium clariflavum]|uniref:Phage tail tube protein n=1 Tax=Novosphingobium clariflavum TaxID=2029884 RepID=A0ABV6S5X9_9SPHN|nr:phage tail tube protein [Novosphingobium clariflavum]